jgi:Protein of unknown function (DUF4238)
VEDHPAHIPRGGGHAALSLSATAGIFAAMNVDPSAAGYPTDPIADRQAQRWFATSDPAVYVGSKHHTMPGFILRRFAEGGKRLLVWRRATGEVKPGNVDDLAITNFYTILNTDGQFDGRMEQLLGTIEADAAQVLKLLLLSALRRPGPLTAEQRSVLCQLVAFQMVRGPRKRREIELLGDYGWKTLDNGQLNERDLRELTAVPHPNEHIRLMGPVSQAIWQSLLRRPVQLIRLDAPLLVISDEPVIVDTDEHAQHLPECSLTQGQRRQRQRRNGTDSTFRDIVHIWPTKPAGVEVAEAIGMPLSPSALLVFGGIGEHLQPEIVVTGEEATQLADSVNAALTAQAYDWIAANPNHPTFGGWTFPPPGPLLGVCDGGSIMSKQLRSAPIHRWQRIRKDWPGSS